MELASRRPAFDTRTLHVIDLRSDRELHSAEGPVDINGVIVHRHPLDDPGLGDVPAPQRGIAEFREHYLRLVDPAAPVVAQLVRLLAPGSTRVAFGCRLGKDRTGLVALLLLTVLGIRRRDIIQDFALTARVFRRTETWLASYAREQAEPAREVLRRCSLPASLAGAVLDELGQRVGCATALVEYLGLDPGEAHQARLHSLSGA